MFVGGLCDESGSLRQVGPMTTVMVVTTYVIIQLTCHKRANVVSSITIPSTLNRSDLHTNRFKGTTWLHVSREQDIIITHSYTTSHYLCTAATPLGQRQNENTVCNIIDRIHSNSGAEHETRTYQLLFRRRYFI